MLLGLYAVGFALGFTLIRSSAAQCECGYHVNNDRYTNAIITHFSRILDVDDISEGSGNELVDWEVQDWRSGSSKMGYDKLLPKANEPSNVWIQGGQLYMRQKGYSKEDLRKQKSVQVAEMITRRDDILYGSFRARFRVKVEDGTQGGAVAGFFFYRDEKSETDIEILTREGVTKVHYSQQPSYNSETDSDYPGTTVGTVLKLPWTEMQEHRWDWYPGTAKFYQDGAQVSELTTNTPKDNGTINLNIWADNGEWSGEPATKDVIMEIQQIDLYFNTSLSHNGGDSAFNDACEKAGGLANENATCLVEQSNSTTSSSGARLGTLLGQDGLGFAFLVPVVVVTFAVFF